MSKYSTKKDEFLVPCIDVSHVDKLLCTDIELTVIFPKTCLYDLKLP